MLIFVNDFNKLLCIIIFAQAAQKFYSLLVLKKSQVLELEQNAAYDELFVMKGLKFENPVL